jgi:hypothetical protein
MLITVARLSGANMGSVEHSERVLWLFQGFYVVAPACVD